MSDETALRETIDDYFLGLYYSDAERLGRAFHPNTRRDGTPTHLPRFALSA
jgi:hypothetical protein